MQKYDAQHSLTIAISSNKHTFRHTFSRKFDFTFTVKNSVLAFTFERWIESKIFLRKMALTSGGGHSADTHTGGGQSKKFSGNPKISFQLHCNPKISPHPTLRNQ